MNFREFAAHPYGWAVFYVCRFHSLHLAPGISFLLQRIISHLPLSCVIIFLYLKRRRESRCLQRLMVRRPSG
nr:MAG TPA: hypothetical protein [Bacteriophage sp.]